MPKINRAPCPLPVYGALLFIIYGALNVNAIKSARHEYDIKLHIPLTINYADREVQSCTILWANRDKNIDLQYLKYNNE